MVLHTQQHVNDIDPLFYSPWLQFNPTLDRDSLLLLNESILERRIEDAFEIENDDQRLFWLSLARITELAIIQAGNYADSCEFQAAGDLLVNPRRIDIYMRGWTNPVCKDRHRGLSDQFAEAIGCEDPVAWLRRETIPHICKNAILPELMQTLSSSDKLNPDYLADLDRRMCRVADTIAFLRTWQIADSTDLFLKIQHSGPEGQAFILSNLCRFDDESFHAMGADILCIFMNARCSTSFLRGGGPV